MKILFIGGTGRISAACAAKAAQNGWDVALLNRGNDPGSVPDGAEVIRADVSDEDAVRRALAGRRFDCAADFLVYTPEQARGRVRLFSGLTDQFIFIGTASAYHKPASDWLITEGTPLANPYWKYSREKIACEEVFMAEYRENGFPVTVARPSHTYDHRAVPVPIHGAKGSWQVIARILAGKPVIVHGDGLSFWTFTHSSDFAEAFAGLIGNPHAIGEAVHITSDEKLTWNAAFAAIGHALGKKADLLHVSSEMLAAHRPDLEGSLLGDKAPSIIFDNTKLKRLVPGFTAKVRFDQGVRGTLEYVLSHEDCRVEDPEFDGFCDMIERKYREFVAP
ncbi:MAG: NAD-dependent epimerase/dehydratase family protein [Firmicutes bacterium]|nr:NAD-dependent epimerase/dehydratase family protein [Bacillota bacterium]